MFRKPTRSRPYMCIVDFDAVVVVVDVVDDDDDVRH